RDWSSDVCSSDLSGPSAEPRVAPAAALPPSTRMLTSIATLPASPFQHANVVAPDRDRDRNDGLDELDRDLFLRLVDLLHAGLFTLERSRDELDDRSLDESFDRDLGHEQRLDLFERGLAVDEAPRLADPLEHLPDALEAHALGEDVAAQGGRDEQREDDVRLLFGP